jgi:hypothetical protein
MKARLAYASVTVSIAGLKACTGLWKSTMTNSTQSQPTIDDRIRALRRSAANTLKLCESIRQEWSKGRCHHWKVEQVDKMRKEAQASWAKANGLLASGSRKEDKKQLALL